MDYLLGNNAIIREVYIEWRMAGWIAGEEEGLFYFDEIIKFIDWAITFI